MSCLKLDILKKKKIFFTISISVEEQMCKLKQRVCVETGGACKLGAKGIYCVCPTDASYVRNKGCQGR